MSRLVYYFSGTRNSRYAAVRIASLIGGEARFIPTEEPCVQQMEPGGSVGFVFPVYAWGVPPIVLDFIEGLPEEMLRGMSDRSSYVWCVATCGDETGMAVEMLRKKLASKGVILKASWSLIMPNVYVLLPGFGTDPKEIEDKKIKEANGRIEDIAKAVGRGERKSDVHRGPFARIKTGIVYPLFKRWGVDTRKWHYTDACIGCTKCSTVCPVGNISITDGHPEWDDHCASCCACFHVCPVRSVQYSSITRKMGQYRPKF